MTTPIIHPINEKKPEFPCRVWMGSWRIFKDATSYGFSSLRGSHWSPGIDGPTPLPPEVTPEQIPAEFDEALADMKAGRFVDFDKAISTPPPASGPSPAALEVAAEIHPHYGEVWFKQWQAYADEKNFGEDIFREYRQNHETANAERLRIAAIIDRKFPREEDGALLRWVRENCRIVYYPPNNAYPVEHAPAAGKDMWQHFVDSARSALQDSREGSK